VRESPPDPSIEGVTMICTLTARRLEPGQAAAFKVAFERAGQDAPEEVMKRWKKIYICRDVTDPDVVLTFGLFDGTVDELRALQSEMGGEEQRVAEFDQYVAEVLLDGSYDVIEEIEP
jgi:hypothetical protein